MQIFFPYVWSLLTGYHISVSVALSIFSEASHLVNDKLVWLKLIINLRVCLPDVDVWLIWAQYPGLTLKSSIAMSDVYPLPLTPTRPIYDINVDN